MNGLTPQPQAGGADFAEMLRKFLRDTGFAGAGNLEQLLRALASGGGATGALGGAGGTAASGGFGGTIGGGGGVIVGGGGAGCMDGDTMVQLLDGTLMAHADLRPGHTVIGRGAHGELLHNRVTDVWETEQPRVEIFSSHGLPFVCSRSHRIMVVGRLDNGRPEMRDVTAGELAEGAMLVIPGGWAKVERIEALEPGSVFGLTCDGNHTYWAAEHLQHNKTKPAETPSL